MPNWTLWCCAKNTLWLKTHSGVVLIHVLSYFEFLFFFPYWGNNMCMWHLHCHLLSFFHKRQFWHCFLAHDFTWDASPLALLITLKQCGFSELQTRAPVKRERGKTASKSGWTLSVPVSPQKNLSKYSLPSEITWKKCLWIS